MNKLALSLSLSVALFSGTAIADESIYHGFQGTGAFGNPDHNMAQYPTTMVDPSPSGHDIVVSLHTFQQGSPDGYRGEIEGYVPFVADSGSTITSLDVFQRGNPDHDHVVDYSLPVIGSDEALAAAQATRARRAASTGSSSNSGV